MRNIVIEVRKNSLVITFDVKATGLGTVSQDAFQQVSPGVYQFKAQADVSQGMMVRLSIAGQGSDVQPPRAFCFTTIDGQRQSAYLAAAVGSGKTRAQGDLVYPVDSDGISDKVEGNHGIPLAGLSMPLSVVKEGKKK